MTEQLSYNPHTPATPQPGPAQDAGPRETAGDKGSAPAPAAAATAAVAAKTEETPQRGKVAGRSGPKQGGTALVRKNGQNLITLATEETSDRIGIQAPIYKVVRVEILNIPASLMPQDNRMVWWRIMKIMFNCNRTLRTRKKMV